jgi:hypothetical protein
MLSYDAFVHNRVCVYVCVCVCVCVCLCLCLCVYLWVASLTPLTLCLFPLALRRHCGGRR